MCLLLKVRGVLNSGEQERWSATYFGKGRLFLFCFFTQWVILTSAKQPSLWWGDVIWSQNLGTLGYTRQDNLAHYWPDSPSCTTLGPIYLMVRGKKSVCSVNGVRTEARQTRDVVTVESHHFSPPVVLHVPCFALRLCSRDLKGQDSGCWWTVSASVAHHVTAHRKSNTVKCVSRCHRVCRLSVGWGFHTITQSFNVWHVVLLK